MSLVVGQEAPDFEIKDSAGTPVRLSSFRGQKNVVLVFFPLAFSPTCTGELCEIRDKSVDFVNDDVQLLGISVDSTHTLRAFAAAEGLQYPLLSDFQPRGAVAELYDSFLAERGFATRGTFIIDKQGILRWSVVNSPADARSSDEYKAALAAL